MLELIRKGAKLSEENRPLLWSEVALFSVLAGLVCHSWVVFILVAAMLSWVMTTRNGMFYIIFAISILWALMPACWGLAGGGWLWALIVGGTVLLWAFKVHVNGLKWQWDELVYKSDNTVEWKQMFWSGPNANRIPRV